MGWLKPLQAQPVPRPLLWRLCLVQSLAWFLALAISWMTAPQYVASIAWAGALTISAQAFWVWRSLKAFGDSESARYLVGALAGLLGKWMIILIGLVLLWRNQPDLSVGATVVTVFVLNTLAALAAPISISQPR